MPVRRRPHVGTVLTALFIGCAVALYAWGPRSEPRYVVIHSDDAGMYPSVNAATIEGMEKGIVSSCSIMVPCSGFGEFAEYARSCPEKDFGVHLTLNCERRENRWGPVSPRESVPSLVDPAGFFWATPQETVQHAKFEEVERELRAQIDKAQASGIRLSHLDHHMFVLCKRSDVLKLYIQLGAEYGLPVRYSKVLPDPDDLDRTNAQLMAVYQEGLEYQYARGMPVFEEIDSRNYDAAPDEKRAYFLKLLPRLKPGVSEILIHCAYGPLGPLMAPHADRREMDMHVFCSPEMRDALRREGIRVITWKQFRDMAKANQGNLKIAWASK